MGGVRASPSRGAFAAARRRGSGGHRRPVGDDLEAPATPPGHAGLRGGWRSHQAPGRRTPEPLGPLAALAGGHATGGGGGEPRLASPPPRGGSRGPPGGGAPPEAGAGGPRSPRAGAP